MFYVGISRLFLLSGVRNFINGRRMWRGQLTDTTGILNGFDEVSKDVQSDTFRDAMMASSSSWPLFGLCVSSCWPLAEHRIERNESIQFTDVNLTRMNL